MVGVEVRTMNIDERKLATIEGVGFLGIENAHDKEFEDFPRPKASGTNEDVEACKKANENWKKLMSFTRRINMMIGPHNLEVTSTKKTSGKSGKGKK